MIFFDTYIQVFTAFAVWILSFFIIEFFRKKFILDFNKTYLLYFWHSFFTIVYMLYIENHSADAKMYYWVAVNESELITFGFKTNFIKYLTFIFYYLFNLSWFGMFLLFNLFGFLGLLAFWASLEELTSISKLKKLILLIVFLPGLSFWSVAIGKDSLSLLCVGFLLYSLVNLKKRYVYFFTILLVLFFLRPHICGVVLISLLSSYLIIYMLKEKIDLSKKIFILVSISILILVVINFILNYLGIGFDEIFNYLNSRASYNQKGDGAIDITEMILIEQLFTYAFRPLPFEINSFVGIYIGIENLFLLFLFCFFLSKFFKLEKSLIEFNIVILFSTIFVLIMWSLLAMTTGNMGISIRQKWMFFPFLLYMIVYILNLVENKKEIK